MSLVMPAVWPDGTPITDRMVMLLVATPDFRHEASAIYVYRHSAPTPTPTPSNPSVEISPSTGSAGTRVNLRGGGFPPSTRLGVYLAGVVRAAGVGNQPTSYATTTTDSRGAYAVSFVMPTTWPSGAKIEAGTLSVLVATSDFEQRATATFEYVEPEQPPGDAAWRGEYYAESRSVGQPRIGTPGP